ncbi:hypothetical protein ACFFRR_010093 [Megaselia abdita]
MNRWWDQYITLPWSDVVALFVSANLHGHDDRGRLMRRTVVRYMCLSQAMCFMLTSTRVKRRFPNLSYMIDAGLLLESEKLIIDELISRFPKHSKHWMPLMWATSIITRARKEGRIRDDFAVNTIINAIQNFRANLNRLISYNTVSVPLIYTQVVTLAVYSFFLTKAMGSQYIEGGAIAHLYFPFFTTLQFFFYVGWLKVAEQLINPFGEDDDDFEINWFIDRNLQVCYMIVDEMHHEHPELIKDQFWDEVFPIEVPYTAETEKYREDVPESSTAKIAADMKDSVPSHLTSVKVNDKMKNGGLDGKIRRLSENSTVENKSGKGTLPRVAAALNRFLSSSSHGKMTISAPVSRAHSFVRSRLPSAEKQSRCGSVRISNQVIEELDEQLTISQLTQSKMKDYVNRPKVIDFFSAMDNKEGSRISSFVRSQSTASAGNSIVFNQFATGDDDVFISTPNPSIASLNGEEIIDKVTVEDLNPQEDDEFEKLRRSRSSERRLKNHLRLARSISAQPFDSISAGCPRSPTIVEENNFFNNDDIDISKFASS